MKALQRFGGGGSTITFVAESQRYGIPMADSPLEDLESEVAGLI